MNAKNKKSLRFVIENGVLKNKNTDITRIVNKIYATFICFYQRGLHSVDSLLKDTIIKHFYVPVKVLNLNLNVPFFFDNM